MWDFEHFRNVATPMSEVAEERFRTREICRYPKKAVDPSHRIQNLQQNGHLFRIRVSDPNGSDCVDILRSESLPAAPLPNTSIAMGYRLMEVAGYHPTFPKAQEEEKHSEFMLFTKANGYKESDRASEDRKPCGWLRAEIPFAGLIRALDVFDVEREVLHQHDNYAEAGNTVAYPCKASRHPEEETDADRFGTSPKPLEGRSPSHGWGYYRVHQYTEGNDKGRIRGQIVGELVAVYVHTGCLGGTVLQNGRFVLEYGDRNNPNRGYGGCTEKVQAMRSEATNELKYHKSSSRSGEDGEYELLRSRYEVLCLMSLKEEAFRCQEEVYWRQTDKVLLRKAIRFLEEHVLTPQEVRQVPKLVRFFTRSPYFRMRLRSLAIASEAFNMDEKINQGWKKNIISEEAQLKYLRAVAEEHGGEEMSRVMEDRLWWTLTGHEDAGQALADAAKWRGGRFR